MAKARIAQVSLNHPQEGVPLGIVASSLVATQGVGDGRFVPLLIIDAAPRPDIVRLVEAHAHLGVGDVTSDWFRRSRWSTSSFNVLLRFTNPVACTAIIEFKLPERSATLDQVMQVQGFYLQPGKPGDTIHTTFASPRILVETPTVTVRLQWEQMFLDLNTRHFRKQGLSRSSARSAAAKMIQEWRTLSSRRLSSDP